MGYMGQRFLSKSLGLWTVVSCLGPCVWCLVFFGVCLLHSLSREVVATWEGVRSCVGAAGNAGNTRC